MKLVGRDLSPYVRRVAIWLTLQERAFEREILGTFDPEVMDRLNAVHPSRRVPALVLDDGTSLIESFAICDYLDETMPHLRLVPESGPARRVTLQRIALAHSTTEKIVAVFYEKGRRPPELVWDEWLDRLAAQTRDGLAAMEANADPAGAFGGADGPDGGDIAVVCAFQMAKITSPWLIDREYKALEALEAQAMALAPFAETYPG
ncbi:glutathione S-transferase [Acuticoccus sp. MNP-M23]|uniref:glutathione S-transferase family protein n=1 Tax=Acuticoccus sp. MNP-M23 TaxID=3072793 RepID=UPI0028163AE9|nr:glutathione S-transferase [Acuticoccus sp. MNP-M23]WMS42257.1 glutathione S-transferase [Acuticoccus sp. MNP-M23]